MNHHLNTALAVAVLQTAMCISSCGQLEAKNATKAEIVSVSSVGPTGESQSDADIVRYNDRFFVAFARPVRDGQNAIHILQSADCREWEHAATLLSKSEARRLDFTASTYYSGRPVWFSIMPSGRLCVTGRGSKKAVLWSTDNGTDWQEELDIDLKNSYSRILWHDNRAYCSTDETSSCGERYELFRVESAVNGAPSKTTYKLSHDTHTLTGPRESQLAIAKDHAVCLLSFETYDFDKVRRWLIPGGKYARGKLGVSKPPFDEWSWKPTNLNFGHPNLLELNNGRLLATVYIDGDNARNALCEVDASTGQLTELLRLPTDGTAQPIGMTEHDGHIWACFYDGPLDRKNPSSLKVAKIKHGSQEAPSSGERTATRQDAPNEQ